MTGGKTIAKAGTMAQPDIKQGELRELGPEVYSQKLPRSRTEARPPLSVLSSSPNSATFILSPLCLHH